LNPITLPIEGSHSNLNLQLIILKHIQLFIPVDMLPCKFDGIWILVGGSIPLYRPMKTQPATIL